ncbi:MAG: MFS transporter [Candidatus Bathyarchaeia archaeon]
MSNGRMVTFKSVEVLDVLMHVLRELFSPLTGNLRVLILSLLIWSFFEQMILTYEPLYVFALGGSGLVLGFITSLQTLLGSVLRILGGYVADTRGRRLLIGWVTVVSSFGYLAHVFATNWVWLLFGVSLTSLLTLSEPAVEAIKADSVKPDQRGRGFVLFNNLPQIPALIAPALGGLFIVDISAKMGIDLTNTRIAYFLLFLSMLSAGIIRLLFLEETLRDRRNEGDVSDLHMVRVAYRSVLENADFRRLVILTGIFMFLFHFDDRIRSVYVVEIKKLTTVEWGKVLSISQIASIMAVFAIGWIIDRYGRKSVFLVSLVALGLSSFLTTVATDHLSFVAVISLRLICLKTRMVALQALMADFIPSKLRGRFFGVVNISSSVGTSASVLISGILYDLNPQVPFYFSTIAHLLAALLAQKYLQESGSESSDSASSMHQD